MYGTHDIISSFSCLQLLIAVHLFLAGTNLVSLLPFPSQSLQPIFSLLRSPFLCYFFAILPINKGFTTAATVFLSLVRASDSFNLFRYVLRSPLL